MGGKRKQAARTKGNTRPSSSGRTAERLACSGNSLQNFIGFSGFRDTVVANDGNESSMDADFRLVMKKMTKRDAVTKLKAIQEFNSLCKEKSSQDVANSLSMWPRLFNKLAMDCDRRVRESLFEAHEQLVIGTRKSLAPYLRSIMGSWLMGCCDPHPPTATAANKSFSAAFPPTKQSEAIVFCKTEILAFVEDNLFHQTAQTLSDPESTSSEEMESKYIRVISSSLLTLKLVLEMFPASERDGLTEPYRKMFSEAKFWKLAKDSDPVIRRAWFGLVCSICQFIISSVNEKKLCAVVFNSLDETEATVLPVVWDAVMIIVSHVDNCWSHVNGRKMFIPKLWSVLQTGGHGNARVIFPNLLPLLHKLPAEVVGDVAQFYPELFSRIRKSLSLSTMQSSIIEMNVIVETLVECLKYVLQMENEHLKLDHLITTQLLPVMKLSFCDTSSKLCSTRLYNIIRDLFVHWRSSTTTNERYAKLAESFVADLQDLCVDIVSTSDSTCLARVRRFLLCLLGEQRPINSSARVRFEENPEASSEANASTLDDELLLGLIRSVCVRCLHYADTARSVHHLKFISAVSNVYPDESLLLRLTLAKSNDEETPLESLEIGKIFFDQIVRDWLTTDGNSDEIFVDLIDLSSSCYKYSAQSTKTKILNVLCETENPFLLEGILRKWDRQDPIYTSWLRSNQFGDTLVNMSRRLPVREDGCLRDAVCGLLSLCFSFEFVRRLSTNCVRQIFESFCEMFSDFGDDSPVKFVCSLISTFYDNLNGVNAEDKDIHNIVISMLAFVYQPPARVEEQIIAEVEVTFLLAMKNILMRSDLAHVIERIKIYIENAIENENENLDKLVNVISSLLPDVARCGHLSTTSLINPDWTTIMRRIGSEWIVNCVLQDKITMLNYECESGRLTTCAGFVRWCHFFSRLLISTPGNELHTVWRDALSSHIKHIIFAHLYVRLTDIDRQFVDISSSFDEFFKWTLDFLDGTARDVIAGELYDLSVTIGGVWSLCLSEFVTMFDVKRIHRPMADVNASFPLSQPKFHTALVTHSLSERDWLSYLLEMHSSCDLTSAAELTSLFRAQFRSSNDIDCRITKFIDVLIFWRDNRTDWFSFACDINDRSWLEITFNVEVERTLTVIVQKFWTHLSAAHWDFILCALCSWIQSCDETIVDARFATQLYVRESCRLFASIDDLIQNASSLSFPHPHLIAEWSEFFCEGVFSVLLPLFLSASDTKPAAEMQLAEKNMLTALSSSVEKIPSSYMKNHNFPAIIVESTEDDSLPDNLKTLLYRFCPLLRSNLRSVRLCSFRLLSKLIPSIVEHNEPREEDSRQLPSSLKLLLTETTFVVNSLLASNVGVATTEPTLCCLQSYLLSWSLFMELFGASSSELRSEYASHLQSVGLLPDLLANLFNLIPESSMQTSKLRSMFTDNPPLRSCDDSTLVEIQHLSCRVYFEAVKKLPALVRQWWNNQEKQVLTLVDRVTSKYISPILTLEELEAVQNSGHQFLNMSIRSRVKTGEVIAVYTIDEISMELIVKLAPNHPLGAVTVECGKRMGVGQAQWRNWMLQLNTFLTYQNGSILDGLCLWKRNIDKKFEGIEECFICYYVLHGSSCQLPRLTCRTCKKKFHSACLYKWFSTSNQSTCPLCRNLF